MDSVALNSCGSLEQFRDYLLTQISFITEVGNDAHEQLRCPQLRASQLSPLKQLLVTYPMLSRSPLCSVCPKLSLIYLTDLAPSPGGRTLLSTHHPGCFLPSLPTITNSHQVLEPTHTSNLPCTTLLQTPT